MINRGPSDENRKGDFVFIFSINRAKMTKYPLYTVTLESLLYKQDIPNHSRSK